MSEMAFNLLDEPWIKVLTHDLMEEEVSLKTLFSNAHQYKALSGETPQQNAANLRFLLAILITVFYRYDENGAYAPIDEDDEAEDVIMRWQAVWDKGKFPENVMDDYLEQWRSRFWLFHPERPFLQVAGLTAKTATAYAAATLISDMKLSGNHATKHHFALREGRTLSTCSFSEAARGLIFLNAYSINVKKPSRKECGIGSRIGRLGQLGLVLANGDSLFETLMLNAVLLKDGIAVWPKPCPTWERENVDKRRGIAIGAPDNLPELYTIPRRTMLLKCEEDQVIAVDMAGGEYYEDNAFNEQMTLWQERKDPKTKEIQTVPKRHSPDVQMWREFSAIFGANIADNQHNGREPGLIGWLKTLISEKMIAPETLLRIQAVGMTYDNMSYAYVDTVDDRIALSYQLLEQANAVWRQNITEEIEKCEQVGILLRTLGNHLTRFLKGDKGENSITPALQSVFYAAVDQPFRDWLIAIRPDEDDREQTIKAWEKTAYRLARKTVEDYVKNADLPLFVIKTVKEVPLSVPKIINDFMQALYRLYSGGFS